MARPEPTDKTVETWEVQTGGTVWIHIYDRRSDRYIKQRVGGRQGGSKRLRITADDRRYNQEQIVEEMKEHDPFSNGLLKLVSAEVPEDIDTTYHLTTEDLEAVLKLEDQGAFQEAVSNIKSELIIRRLLGVAEKKGTVAQLAYIKELVTERYPVGGTQPAVQEMIDAGEKLSGTILS